MIFAVVTEICMYVFLLPVFFQWGVWAGGTWAHFQGGVGAALSMWKPDVKEAVKEFLCCSKKSEADGEVRDFPPKSRASVGLFGGLSRLTIGSSTRWSSWSNRWSTGFGDKARNRVSLNQNGDHRTSNLGRDNMDIKALDPIAEARSSQETRSTLFESQAPPITEIEHLPAVQETSQDSFNEDEQQVIKENSDIMLVMKETKSQDEGPADEEQENTETTEVDDLVDGTEMNTNQGIDASKPGNSEDSVRDVEEGLCELQARRVDFCGEIYDSINSDSIE